LGTAPHTIKAVSSNSMRGDRNPQDPNNLSNDDLRNDESRPDAKLSFVLRHSSFVIRHFRLESSAGRASSCVRTRRFLGPRIKNLSFW